jgi:hypothetical protein
MGARIIRLDAIAYLWKTIGTRCIHLPPTHEIVKLVRDFLAVAAPDVLAVTETNVPHADNVSYFGRSDEAHLVYQFALPPLLADAFLSGDARALTRWAAEIQPPPSGCTFLNFTASHDGIGVDPLRGFVSDARLEALVDHVKRRGGMISNKTGTDGRERPYELNITWFDVMGAGKEEPPDAHIARFLCSQTIPLALQGIPAVYFHSLTGSSSDHEAFRHTGRARSLNRGRWQNDALAAALADGRSTCRRVFNEYVRLLAVRARHAAFHPAAGQRVVPCHDAVFAVERHSTDGKELVLALSNVGAAPAELRASSVGWTAAQARSARNLLAPDTAFDAEGALTLRPYETAWLAIASG